MKNLLNRIIDIFRKRKILRDAKNCGCDDDGDLLMYKGTLYVVFIFRGEIFRAKIPNNTNLIEEEQNNG